MKPIESSDIWELTLHYYPRAAEAGLLPVLVTTFGSSNEEWNQHPEWYTTHSWTFDRPPSKADFLAVTACTPWMQGQQWIDPIKWSDWPHVQQSHKGSGDSPLYDELGRKVGHLTVWRDTYYRAQGYDRQFLTSAAERLALRGVPKDRYDACERLFRERRHALANYLAETSEGCGVTDERLAAEWKKEFRKAGIVGKRKQEQRRKA